MPILDPNLQYTLLTKLDYDENKGEKRISDLYFYLNLLQLASCNIYKNLKSIESYIKFKKDLGECFNFLNSRFKCHINKSDINNPSIENYYKFILDQIKLNHKNVVPLETNGTYLILNDRYLTKFFQYELFSELNCPHSWFFTDSPIAILSITTKLFKGCPKYDYILQSIKLEIDLLAANSYTLVLCVKNEGFATDFILNLIKDNQFSEIHYIIPSDGVYNKADAFFKKYYRQLIDCLQNFRGYFYFYAHYIYQERYIPKDFKMLPHVTIISLSDIFENCFDQIDFFPTDQKFPFLKNCFDSKYLRIKLSNVPLYDSENEKESFIPSTISGFGIGFISPDDFLNYKLRRVHILFIDDSKDNRCFHKYIDFDDIHKIKPDLYIKNQIALAKVNQKTLNKVNKMEYNIKKKIDDKINKDFTNENIFSIFKEQKTRNSLELVAYAYSYVKHKEGEAFFAHTTQIYTAYQALKKFILKKSDKNNKGVVFQVETGEGKTYIVCLIAAALSKMGKTVHITSSNINLSIRDYEESFKFFSLLKIETALLLHSNELPNFVRKKYKIDDKITVIDKIDTTSNEVKKSEVDIDANNSIFKNNIDNYFKYNTQNVESSLEECYPKKYYNKDLFNNSSRMNFSVCGLSEEKKESDNKADVIFSTFVNFECLYLKMIELYPGSVDHYFAECGLLIDEVDSILIDEIANGTIVSRTMKSNSTEILKFVYEKKKEGLSYQQTCELINKNKNWIIGKKIKEKHIKQMYEEIDIVHKPEYTNGKKYSIEQIVVKKEKKKNMFLKKALKFAADIGKDIVKNFVNEFSKDIKETEDDNDNEDEDNNDDDDDDYETDDEEEEEENEEKPEVFNYIVPFGYDKNGILEPNKEFGGFIQQFIAIKENIDNYIDHMIVNDLSMSYLYVSHPIFVKLYGTVCGFTGTVGNKSDKKLFKNEYGLDIIKVPRHNPNLIVEFPIITCENEDERNEKIIYEVIEFHQRGNPVLVIFQDLNEIEKIHSLLISSGIKSINIFNGKDDILKPDEIAGNNYAVSLGTNVCGRGTDISAKGKPLHVIVTYFTSNTRLMNQAFGRTARQGRKGTCRTICTKKQFFSPINILKNVNSSINEFRIKNLRQKEFVDHYKSKRKWIFTNYYKKQKIDNDSLKIMRKAKINVNRIVAYNYIFPICMTKKTFLTIQKQKIFSLFNCPNSPFTWKLFQRYIREMILESWSLMINKLDQKYKNKEKGFDYDNELIANRKKLYNILSQYLPDSDYEMIPTFMHIFRGVLKDYEKSVITGFTKMAKPLFEFDKSAFFLCKVGFKPYALLSESGARIYSKNFKKMNFIKDPELKYERRTMNKHRFTIASITDKIDDIFNDICKKVNKILGTKTFLKLFLRRTLAGCEFGFCLNLNIQNNNQEFLEKNPYCIIDLDPLLVFTIFVRSLIPIFAIILISVLVYIGVIAKKISKWFTFPSNVKEAVKTTVSIVVDAFGSNISSKIFDKIIEFLESNLNNNIKQLEINDPNSAEIIKTLKNIFSSKKAEDITSNLAKKFENFKINMKWDKLCKYFNDPIRLMKISVFLILLIASFIMNYHHKKIAIENQKWEDYNNETENYLKQSNEQNLKSICRKYRFGFSILDIEQNSKEDLDEIDKEASKSYLYKMTSCNIMNLIVNLSEFKFDKKLIIHKGVSSIIQFIENSYNKSKYLIISYNKNNYNKRAFLQQIFIYKTIQFPSILKLYGFNSYKRNQIIFLESKEKGNLDNYMHLVCSKKENLTETNKLIISYGIARAFEFLHNHKIVHRNLAPLNVYLDLNLYPYISDFYMAKQTETNLPYNLKHSTSEYMAPEFIKDYISNQNSFKIDVYSFGILIYYLITEIKPFSSYSDKEKMLLDISNGKRPEIPKNVDEEWKNLIITCWNQEPDLRPNFTQICRILESNQFINYRMNIREFNLYKDEIIDKQELDS